MEKGEAMQWLVNHKREVFRVFAQITNDWFQEKEEGTLTQSMTPGTRDVFRKIMNGEMDFQDFDICAGFMGYTVEDVLELALCRMNMECSEADLPKMVAHLWLPEELSV
ncbi:MAG: hypothetical protein Q8P86_01915 [bacterium]|nr:hypothetical protein [bacterium]